MRDFGILRLDGRLSGLRNPRVMEFDISPFMPNLEMEDSILSGKAAAEQARARIWAAL